jgi:hypothetical protein
MSAMSSPCSAAMEAAGARPPAPPPNGPPRRRPRGTADWPRPDRPPSPRSRRQALPSCPEARVRAGIRRSRNRRAPAGSRPNAGAAPRSPAAAARRKRREAPARHSRRPAPRRNDPSARWCGGFGPASARKRSRGDRRGSARSTPCRNAKGIGKLLRKGRFILRSRDRRPGGERERDLPRPRRNVIPHASLPS